MTELLIIKQPGQRYSEFFPFMDDSSIFSIALILPDNSPLIKEKQVEEISRQNLINYWTELHEAVELERVLTKNKYVILKLQERFNIFYDSVSKDEEKLHKYIKQLIKR